MNNNGAPNPRNRAIAMASLRAVVAGYLVYLGGKLISDYLKGESEIIPWMVWVFGPLFIVAGLAFGFYTWKRYQKEKAEAQAEAVQESPAETLPEVPEETAEKPEETEETEESSVPEDRQA
ncbi:MAG: hypothetical protein J6Y95_01095 [Lachnospiraceae bacterium]|nr:hypothetical protein [Lachnospiraceae bacterium]